MKKLQLTLAAVAAAGTFSLFSAAPASADGAASTRNIILGAAALAGIAIEANVANKNSRANTVTGYLSDGSRVYADGHVVARNGYAYYPGNNGQTVSCANGRCDVAYVNQYGNGYNPSNARPNNGSGNGRFNGNPHGGYGNGSGLNGRNGDHDDRDGHDPHR